MSTSLPVQMTRCVNCDRYRYVSSDVEAVTVGTDTYYVCRICADALEGPGKYEGVWKDDRALCVVLEYLYGVSGADHWLTDGYSGYAGVFDRYVLLEDDRGFVTVETFASHDAAMGQVNALEDDGFGADETDAYVSCDHNGYGVSFDGKFVATYPTERRARAKVSLLMRESGYFPNVFLTGEHGPTIRRIEVW